MYTKIVLPASILGAAIIGAGVFSLPFIFNQAGVGTGLFYLFVFSLVYIFIYLLYADLVVRTPGEHRFVGYAKMYLGEGGFLASLLISFVQSVFTLTIYLILAPSFSRLFAPDGYLLHLLIFWALGSLTILFSTRRIAFLEFLIMAGIAAIIFLIFILGFPHFGAINNLGGVDLSKFLVVGPILFALSGVIAVPEVVSYFRETKIPISFLRQSLVVGSVVPAIAYAGFVIGILGLSGQVSEDAVSGLAGKVPIPVLVLMSVLGFLSLISSYIVVGLDSRRILEYDFSFPNWVSKTMIVFLPPLFYFLGFQSFLGLVSFVGSIFLPLESIFIIFMWLKANKKLETPPILVGAIIKNSPLLLLLIFFTVLIYAIIPHP